MTPNATPYTLPNNPYAAPQAPPWTPERYVPLGWRFALATIAIVAVPLCGLALDATTLAFGDTLKSAEPDLGGAAAILLSSVALIGSILLGAIFFGIWIHRAASNLRGLGRTGMHYSPGGCVGWFFVPFANLVQPVKAVSELWRASDPESDGDSWTISPSTSLLGLWWGAWIGGNVLDNISGRLDDASAGGMVGLAGTCLSAVAAVGIILIMRGIGARQQQAAARLGVLPA